MNENLAALLPPVAVLLLFALVIWALVTSDRRERAARAKIAEKIARDRDDHSGSPHQG